MLNELESYLRDNLSFVFFLGVFVGAVLMYGIRKWFVEEDDDWWDD